MIQEEEHNDGSRDDKKGRWERIDFGDLASPFCAQQNDMLLKFPIGDWFPPNDPEALLVLQFLTAWEDLATIDRFKEVLWQAQSQVAEDEIGTT